MMFAKQTGIRNVQEGKTLQVVETKSRDSDTGCVGQLRVWFGKKETVMEEMDLSEGQEKVFV